MVSLALRPAGPPHPIGRLPRPKRRDVRKPARSCCRQHRSGFPKSLRQTSIAPVAAAKFWARTYHLTRAASMSGILAHGNGDVHAVIRRHFDNPRVLAERANL